MSSARIIHLPKITDPRGNLSFLEGLKHIPFEIKRAYWIYDVPGGEIRGSHAFKEQHEFIVAMSGSFDVIVDKGFGRKRKFSLNRSYFGLYVPAGHWRQMLNFSSSSIALVLTSTLFDENDYIRDYNQFLKLKENHSIPKLMVHSSENDSYSTSLIVPSKTSIADCKMIELDKHHREKGNMTVVENAGIVPFDINRIYYLYDVPGGEERGGHAHKELYQMLVAAGGSFDVTINDGKSRQTFTLNRPYQGLKIVPGIWRELYNFSSGSCCLVLASHYYRESEYIRDWNEFITLKEQD